MVKAWHGEILVDLIFAPKGVVVDDAFLDRCHEMSVAAVDMRVIPLEDLLVGKLLALTEHNLDFGPPLEWARAIREQVDWQAVAARTAESPFARTFLSMLDELGVIERTARGRCTMSDSASTGAEVPLQYVVAHVRDALAHDSRVAALDLQVRIVGDELFLTGVVSSVARRDAAEAVVRAEVPHLGIHNQLDVMPADAPTGREDIA